MDRAPPGLPRWIRFATLAAVVAVVFARKPEQLQHPQFWAEDGVVFFAGALDHPLRSLVTPYAGYHLAFIRLVALFWSWLPPRLAPTAYAWSALAIVVAVAAFALSDRIPLRPAARVFMALALAAAPIIDEVYLYLANAQWFLALGLLLVVVARPPRNRREATFDLAAVVLLGLNGPFAVVFAPLFAARAAADRSRWATLLLVLDLAAALLQLQLLEPTRLAGTSASPRRMFMALGWMAQFMFAPWAPNAAALLWCALGTVALWGALAFFGLRRGTSAPAFFCAAAFLILASAIWMYRADPDRVVAGRYCFIPVVATAWALAAFVPAPPVLAAFAAMAVSFVHLARTRGRAPDLHWPERSRCLSSGRRCSVPILPPGWMLNRP